MAFFGLFGKKKEKKPELKPTMPKPPLPPSPLSPGEDKSITPPQHVDDLGAGIGKSGEIKPPKGLELPELEFPKLEIPNMEEKEITKAVEAESKPMPKPGIKKEPPKSIKAKKDIPEHLPDIEAAPEPMAPKPKVELVKIEEPIELKPASAVKGPVFIRSDQFKAIKTNVLGLRESLNKAEETLNNVIEIKNREESEYESWHGAAEAIQRKLLYVDKMLFD